MRENDFYESLLVLLKAGADLWGLFIILVIVVPLFIFALIVLWSILVNL